ncbi:MAG TPA: DUF6531 domain-containing protein, partial [Anaerolineae bacterium]|nr:DUF6531 domain-containing protein [Anaerolineae bacterium]
APRVPVSAENISTQGSSLLEPSRPNQWDYLPTLPDESLRELGMTPAELAVHAGGTMDMAHPALAAYSARQGAREGVVAGASLPQATTSVAESINLHSGEFVHEMTLLRIPGRGLDYVLSLEYHSQLVYSGPVGWGWDHSYDRRLVPASGGSLTHLTEGGRTELYALSGSGFSMPVGRYTSIISDTTGIVVSDRSGLIETYFPLSDPVSPGRLRSLADRNGNALKFTYDWQGLLWMVVDTLGRSIVYNYGAGARIIRVTDFTGRSVELEYDEHGDLVTIVTPAVNGTAHGNDFPDGKVTRLTYTSSFEDERLNHNLTAIVSPNEVHDGSMTPRIENVYGIAGVDFDRVVQQSWGGGRANGSGHGAGADVTLAYDMTPGPSAPIGAAGRTTVTDRDGHNVEFWHDAAGRRLRTQQQVGGRPVATDFTYNIDGQLTSITNPLGNRIEYVFDERNAQSAGRGNLLLQRQVADSARGGDGLGRSPSCPDLVIRYTYDPSCQRLQSISDANGHTTSYAYDGRCNLIALNLPEVTVGSAAPQAATKSWTYNAHGQPTSFRDPGGAVAVFEYFDTDPERGYLRRVTLDSEGAAATTQYEVDPLGNVTSVTDPRGIRTEYVVNERGQVVSATFASSVTAGASSVVPESLAALDYTSVFWYDANDNLVQYAAENVSPDLDSDFHPTGTHTRVSRDPWLVTEYVYDLLDNLVLHAVEVNASAQAITEFRRGPSEHLVSITDPRGSLIHYEYEERGLLAQVTLGAETAEASSTTYEYDLNGNLIRFLDGEDHPTDYAYSGFDRLAGSVDALGSIWTWTYDPGGRVTSVQAYDGQDGRNPEREHDAPSALPLRNVEHRYDERNRRHLTRWQLFTTDIDTGEQTMITTDNDGDGWAETSFLYDQTGNLEGIVDDNGHTTIYSHDKLSRLTGVTDAMGNSLLFGYEGSGNL